MRFLVVLLALSVVAGACVVSRRNGFSRDALERSYDLPPAEKLPSTSSLLALRVPTPPAKPAAITGSKANVAFANGEAVVDDDAAACLMADVRRDYKAVVDRCLSFVDLHPADARAPGAVRVVTRHLGSLPDDGRKALFLRTANVVAACADKHGALSCGDLALVVDDARRQAAAARVDGNAANAELVKGTPWLLHGTAEGPFQDADEAFAGSPFSALPLVKHPSYRVFDVDDHSDTGAGTLVPSRRDIEGWWRVILRGSSDDKDVLLAVKAGGPVEVRVDSAPVLVRPRGTLVADLERVPLHLNKGFHTIEVLSYESGGGVRVAVVDSAGQPAFTLQPKQRWGKNTGAADRPDDGCVTALVLPPSFDGKDADVLQTLLFRHVMARGGFGQTVDDERRLARLLLAHYGWSTPALVAAAQTVEDDALPDRLSASLAAPLWERVLAAWPDHPVALLSRARLAAVADPDAALPAWRAVVAARPDYAIGHRELIDALLEHDVVDEAVASAEKLLALGETPENVDAAVPALRAAGQMTRAALLVDKMAGRGRDERWRRLLIAGETAAAKKTLLARAEEGDDAVIDPLLDLVELDEDRATALRLLDAAIARHPNDAQLRLRRARFVGADVDDSAVVGVDLDALLWREAKGFVVPWTPRFAKGDAVVAERRKLAAEPWPGFASVFLLDDLERRFAPDGSSLVLRHWIAELRSKEALDGFGELAPRDGERLLRLRVVKTDGRIVEAERHANNDELSLPALSPGDLVEWLSVTADKALVDGSFWETRSLRQPTPAVERRYLVSVPRVLEERVHSALVHTNGAPAATSTKETSFGVESTLSVFALRGPPLLDEPMSVDREEVEPQVGLRAGLDDSPRESTTPGDTDRYFRRVKKSDLAGRSRVDPWIAAVAAVVAGVGSDDVRLRRVFRFVAEEISPANGPSDAVTVLATGAGERLPVFVALCAAAGLDVHLVALHAPLTTPLSTPVRNSWANVVVRVGDHYAFFGDSAAVLDRLPAAFAGSLTLDLDTAARGVLPDAVVDDATVTVQLDLTLQEGALKGFVALRLPAAVAEAVRPGLRQATEQQLAQLLEGSLAASLPGVQVARVTLPGLDAAAAPLAFVADVEVPVDAAADGGAVRFEHVFAGGAAAAFRAGTPLSSLVRVAERQRPLRVFPEREKLIVQLHLPSTATFVEVPDNVDLRAGPVRLQQTTSVEDGVLTWERTLDRAGARVDVAAWPEVRAALAPLLSRSDARVAFVVATPTGGKGAGQKPVVTSQTR